jgi:hypothetical protein
MIFGSMPCRMQRAMCKLAALTLALAMAMTAADDVNDPD